VEKAEFRTADAQMDPGDLLLLYTDGVVEAVNGERQEFGEERLMTVLERERRAEPPSVIRAVREALELHRDGAPLSDDTTILACRRTS
jgi:sigma-B regulation protein RsbU (phosphoserine phosphatase)